MSTEENESIARRYGEDIWDKGNLAVADELLDANLFDHHPFRGQGQGRESYKHIVSLFRTAFPNFRVSNDDIMVEGDRAILRWSAHGTHQAELAGIPPTGKRVKVTGHCAYRQWQDRGTLGGRQSPRA
jgi:predicted ester cyclase